MRFPHTLSLHDARDIHSLHYHFERSREIFFVSLFPPPSLSLLGEAPSPPFLRYSVSHFSLSGTLPLTANEKDPSTSLGMTLRKRRFPNISFIRDVGYPFPLPSFRAQREIFLALCSFLLLSQKVSPFPRFLVPFAEAFPFSVITHTALYWCARKIEGFARDDVAEVAFSQHTLYTGRGLSIPHTVISSAVEKSSLHSALSCFLRKRFPLFRCLTYGAIPVCKKDPSASLGMTIREKYFLSTAFAGYVG